MEFSPFEERRLACATAQHFGIIGNGKQYILDVHDREIVPFRSFDSRDGLYRHLNIFYGKKKYDIAIDMTVHGAKKTRII